MRNNWKKNYKDRPKGPSMREQRQLKDQMNDIVDETYPHHPNLTQHQHRFDIEFVRDGPPRIAHLANFKVTEVDDEDIVRRSAIILYFVESNGKWFKALYKFESYFYVCCKKSLVE